MPSKGDSEMGSSASRREADLSENPPEKVHQEEEVSGYDAVRNCLSEQNQRLAEWNATQLVRLLNLVVTKRSYVPGNKELSKEDQTMAEHGHLRWVTEGGTIRDEVSHCVKMPEFDENNILPPSDTLPIILSDTVQQQLHDFVSIICSMYKNNRYVLTHYFLF